MVLTEACAAIFSKRSNVDLLHKSLISNSCIAIEVEGEVYDATLDTMGIQKGRVMMDCSKMLNNAIGIYGTKAWLNIDEIVQSGGVNVNAFDNTYTLFANGSGGTTRQTQGRYVDIHYPLSYTAVPVNTLQTTYYGNGRIKASSNKYIDVARTMVFAEKIKEDMPIEQLVKSSINNSMFVFPNPAEGFFKLVLPSGRYDVQLSDVLGRVVKQIQVADYEEISTENIQSGLYQITVRKKGEQAVFQTAKIVIKE